MNVINSSLLAVMILSGADRKYIAPSLIFGVLLINENSYTVEKILGYWVFYLISLIVASFISEY